MRIKKQKKNAKVKTPLTATKIKDFASKLFIYILLIDIAFVILFPLLSKLSASSPLRSVHSYSCVCLL